MGVRAFIPDGSPPWHRNVIATPPSRNIIHMVLSTLNLSARTSSRSLSTTITKMAFETKATITTFGGKLLKLQHQSPPPPPPPAPS